VALNVAAFDPARRASLAWMLNLAALTAERPPAFGCFGLHEWRWSTGKRPTRSATTTWPLRFPPDELARIVEAHPCVARTSMPSGSSRRRRARSTACNRSAPPRRSSSSRGCLHANMDLYKWASNSRRSRRPNSSPTARPARDIREVDMRASPYDLSKLGFAPIRIETPEGRAEYETLQRDFAAQSQPLRPGDHGAGTAFNGISTRSCLFRTAAGLTPARPSVVIPPFPPASDLRSLPFRSQAF